MNEPQVIVDRRKPDSQIEFLTSILQSVQRLNDKIEAMQDVRNDLRDIKRTLTEHIDEENNMCKAAFPDGDPDDHRKFHEALIRKADNERELILEAKKKMLGWGLTALLTAIGVLIVYYWNGHMPASAHITLPKP